MNQTSAFNLRVYGILQNEKEEILVTDEYRMNRYMTKFPGGGLEYGEGTIDCLKREFREELGIDISIKSHFYTTDYYQKAQFFENVQLISIYYIVNFNNCASIVTKEKVNDIPKTEGAQAFRWIDMSNLNEEDFTFPIDRKVVQMLKATL